MPLPATAPPIAQLSARERIYEAIKTWIVEGVLEPEEQLKDVELAERFGVSRTPVREALRQLEDEGLVVTARNRWTRVAPLDLSEGSRLAPILGALEALALRSAWPFAPAQVDEMARANAELERAIERRRAKDALNIDLRFHGVIDFASGNPDLVAMLGRLRDRMRRIDLAYWARPGLARPSVAEHAAIVDAIRSGGLDDALHALELHWRNERMFRLADPPTQA
jgi:DNA-binding GntR family transcriptional regulator